MSELPVGALLLGSLLLGTVVSFDSEQGLGKIRPDGRDYELGFHATHISGGTRWIEPGSRVGFRVVAVNGGELEAGSVTPAG